MHGSFVNVDEYCLDLIPFDYDVLSMEMESSFRVTFSILNLYQGFKVSKLFIVHYNDISNYML